MIWVFASTMALVVTLIGILIFSIRNPSRRFWPPPGQKSWQFAIVWTVTVLSFGGLIVVGVLDWNSLNWPGFFRWPVGIGLILIGNVLAWIGVAQLSFKTTSGAKGELITDGLYSYSRNPQ